jgi:hypothetical protein
MVFDVWRTIGAFILKPQIQVVNATLRFAL